MVVRIYNGSTWEIRDRKIGREEMIWRKEREVGRVEGRERSRGGKKGGEGGERNKEKCGEGGDRNVCPNF